jgi:hypothetical protein
MDPVSFAQFCNNATMYSVFFLDYTRGLAENPGKFRGVIRKDRRKGGKSCGICPAGRCSASIRNAEPVASGCALMPRPRMSAAIAVPLCIAFRPLWVPGFVCVRDRWAATGLPLGRGKAVVRSGLQKTEGGNYRKEKERPLGGRPLVGEGYLMLVQP